MSEMIERVAEAIEALGYANGRTVMLEIARVAIAAMREPTETMLKAGNEDGAWLWDTDNALDGSDAMLIWRAMIDEALR